LNGLALTNYKFDMKSNKKEESEEPEEENEKESKERKKGFQPIENINVIKKDFNLSGIFYHFNKFLHF